MHPRRTELEEIRHEGCQDRRGRRRRPGGGQHRRQPHHPQDAEQHRRQARRPRRRARHLHAGRGHLPQVGRRGVSAALHHLALPAPETALEAVFALPWPLRGPFWLLDTLIFAIIR